MWKWILATIAFFFIVIELVFFAPSSGDRETSLAMQQQHKEDHVDPVDHEQVLSGGHLVESQGETKQWELESEVARKKRGSEEWTLDKVKVKFFGENQVFYRAVGEKGFVTDNQKSLKIEGDVEIVSSNQYVINSEVIYYLTESRTIEGPKPVKMQGPPEANGKGGPLFMEAERFDADLSTNVINLYDNVRGRKTMSDNRNMKIASHKAIFSGQSNYALFKEDVVIHVDSMTITGPRAKFIYKDGALYSLLINGGVKIKDIGKWGKAGEAEVFFQEDKYVFRDSPLVVQGEDELIGDEIIVYDGGERVQVVKAKAKYRANQEESP
ncbi:MAG: LPS export ABC transporter periplasmic protein LptC [Bdellovibrionales bacterium]|nr:LPS export ABC transporter periplasmic protein LptC [Bdellovibrionales bacterium]